MSNEIKSNEFDGWLRSVPEELTQDAVWHLKAYRLALFAADLGFEDIRVLAKTIGFQSLADQLYRALGSISANIAEGFSRYSSREKARFYEYALGSARESRDWYYKSRFILGEAIVSKRYDVLSQIIRLLLTMIPQQRSRLRDELADYGDPVR